MGLVSIAVVTWNSARYLPRCLDGIRAQNAHEVIAVDNASGDDSAALMERAGARVIRNGTNRGFAAAVNQALAAARGEHLLLVNPDCHLAPDYAALLADALDARPEFGSATGLLLRARGFEIEPMEGVDSAGMRMTRTGRHLDIDVAPRELTEVFGVSGAAAMYRVAFLKDAGGFDEDFFAYREDADLAWRGQLLGWRALCEPRALARHVRRVTPEARRELPPEINMHSVKNRFLLRWKNEGMYLALRNAPFELTRDFVVILAALTIERSSLPAFAWLWRNRTRINAKRRAIQKRRKVSDRALARWFR
jgi:GT2 family glycosyltransferase